ncbi:type VI secretion system ATPase TssH [Neoroseomonas oryzicola]|uniref:Type VI secretion system ATPase TssH n=1 Tax=Neoroseomonas oryzicola TaxID=535904 RepID=A0A9X9WN11_9PROT|nr:type VI secretion system ATPase TssH [Neoroseomonas oryzicola]MBR0661721.1 type VI secretion system ATPase TssH [Neoroseomonas oryzicola]NKE17201.1 type VI secretion system ATPase TssH [Neoroseomonas oryzicola]
MVAIDLKSLVGRMNALTRRQLEAAAGLTLSRTHYNVEIEHVLLKLVETSGSDVAAVLRKGGVDAGRVANEITRALDKFKTGNARAPSLSPDIVTWLREAWLLTSLESGSTKIRSGHLLAALLNDDTLGRSVRESAPSLLNLPADAVRRNLGEMAEGSEEAAEAAAEPTAGGAPGGAPSGEAPRSGGPLDQYCTELVAQAKAGKIDPILGRDGEIRQMVDILTRRRQNNPILTGEAGVGKTAVVEGLALRIAAGDVPDALKGVKLYSLDMGLLQAGAGVKGEFENRLKGVIDAVKSSPTPIVMFIDEAHTLIGAGGAAGQNDAANLLKPALARGEMRCIAATTWAEYKKYFEKDAALTRRFQVVKVEEPSEPLAAAMLRGLVGTLEKHHGVRILDEAITQAVKLSARYIPARQLPDKGVSLLDTACARVGMSQAAIPAPVEDRQRRLSLIDTELGAIAREEATGADHKARREALEQEHAKVSAELAEVMNRWEEEKALVAKMRDLRHQIEAAAVPMPGPDGKPAEPVDAEALKKELGETADALKKLQGEEPLVFPVVDGQAVADVVGTWTGIPVGRMVSDEIHTVLKLRDHLMERVVGQDHALDAIAQAIRTSRAGLTDPRKPIGVFLMAGTSGVGKTETALAVADLLYGGEQNMTTINMSEFKEEHKVSLLMGSPPGYVGYGEGGVLTEAVRRRPYSVVLLDEMEKAHPGVQDVFFQVFDKGAMKDGEGRDIDFRNTVIIMTSNAGTDAIDKLCADPDLTPEPNELREALMPELLKSFKPAFLGRTNVVIYYPLKPEILKKIAGLKLRSIGKRLKESYNVPLQVDDAVIDAIVERCKEVSSGARNIDNILSRTVLPELSARILERLAEGHEILQVKVGMNDDGSFRYDVN